jgi:hypothetical protein
MKEDKCVSFCVVYLTMSSFSVQRLEDDDNLTETNIVRNNWLKRPWKKAVLRNSMYRLQNYSDGPKKTTKNARMADMLGAHGSLVVEALGYKPEGRLFESRCGEILNLTNHSGRTMPWGLISP